MASDPPISGLNYGNIHEIMNVLSILVHGGVFYTHRNKTTPQMRQVALLHTSMTGKLLVQHVISGKHACILLTELEENDYVFTPKKHRHYDITTVCDLYQKALTSFQSLSQNGTKTSTVHIPAHIQHLLDFLSLSPKTASAQDKFDGLFVLWDNFDFMEMEIKPGSDWEALNIKSSEKGMATVLNASGDRVMVLAKLGGQIDEIIQKSLLHDKRGPKDLLCYLEKHRIPLLEYDCSPFIRKHLGAESATFARDVFFAMQHGGAHKDIKHFSIAKSHPHLMGNLLGKTASGHTSTSEGNSRLRGNFCAMDGDGKAVLTPYEGDYKNDLLMQHCVLDTPSMTRHTPKKDGILVREEYNEQGDTYLKIVIPFQIRQKKFMV